MFARLLGYTSAFVIAASSCPAQEVPDHVPKITPTVNGALTIRVTDEEGKPVAGAETRLGFRNGSEYKDGYNDFRGKTDANGLFQGESRMTMGEVEIEVTLPGWYPSRKDFIYPYEDNKDFKPDQNLKPWNPVEAVILKKIVNPIPMIVRGSEPGRKAPDVTGENGFDMIEYDWMAPHGKGKVADLRISFPPGKPVPGIPGLPGTESTDPVSNGRIVFVNPDDGLIPLPTLAGEESRLKFPRVAPDEGYTLRSVEVGESGSILYVKDPEAGEGPPHPVGYLFRIRTTRDPETGKVRSARYGKITKSPGSDRGANPFGVGVEFAGEKPVPVTGYFFYNSSINPEENGRNLEWDPERNLATDVEHLSWDP